MSAFDSFDGTFRRQIEEWERMMRDPAIAQYEEMNKRLQQLSQFDEIQRLQQSAFPDNFTEQLKAVTTSTASEYLKAGIGKSAAEYLAEVGIGTSIAEQLNQAAIGTSVVDQLGEIGIGKSIADHLDGVSTGLADVFKDRISSLGIAEQITDRFSELAREFSLVNQSVFDGASSAFAEHLRLMSETALHPVAFDMDKLQIRVPELPPLPNIPPRTDTGRQYYERLVQVVKAFVDDLGDDQEVGVRIANMEAEVEFRLEEIGYKQPGLITFRGTTLDGAEVMLIRHFSQCSIMLMKFHRRSDAPKRGIGFTTPDTE